MSVDPVIHSGSQGINPYSYIFNNPLAGTDPSGYSPDCHGLDSGACDGEKTPKPEKRDETEEKVEELKIRMKGDRRSASLSGRAGKTIKLAVTNGAEAKENSSNIADNFIETNEINSQKDIALNGSIDLASFVLLNLGNPIELDGSSFSEDKEQKNTAIPLLEILNGDQKLESVVRDAIALANAASNQYKEQPSTGVTIMKGEDGYKIGWPNSSLLRGQDQFRRKGAGTDMRKISPEQHVLAIVILPDVRRQSFKLSPKYYNHASQGTGVSYIFVGKKFGKSYFYSSASGDPSSPLQEIDMK